MDHYPKIRITNRECEIIHLLAYEYSTKEIASKLYLSYDTVKSHRRNIMQKLGAKNLAGVVRMAFQMDMIS